MQLDRIVALFEAQPLLGRALAAVLGLALLVQSPPTDLQQGWRRVRRLMVFATPVVLATALYLAVNLAIGAAILGWLR